MIITLILLVLIAVALVKGSNTEVFTTAGETVQEISDLAGHLWEGFTERLQARREKKKSKNENKSPKK